MCINTVRSISRDRKAVSLPTVAAFLWSRTSLVKEFWDLLQEVGGWPGAAIDENCNGLRFTGDGVELGQLSWSGQLVLKSGPETRNAIVAEKIAEFDSDQPDANRVVIDIASANGLNRAICLLRLAYLIADSDRNMHLNERDVQPDLALRNAGPSCDWMLPMIALESRQALSAIVLALDAAHKERGGESTAHWADEIARNQARHMSRIIDNILATFCHARDGVCLNLLQVDLASVVIDSIEAARSALASRGHLISVSLPPEPVFLVVDPSRVVQFLTNLLTNAAKHTDPGGHICLTADLSFEAVVIRVRDNGRGISPELLPHTFNLYQRGPNQKERGLGLGLTLVKSLVELHGGSVVVHSDGLTMGSEFIVRLPISCELSGQRGSQGQPVAPTGTKVSPIPSSNTRLLA